VEPYSEFFLDLRIEYPQPIGKQHFSSLITPEVYKQEIAFARSPLRCPIEETSTEKLKDWFRGYDQSKDAIVYYSKEKYLTKLRAKDEAVRHKALDFIGDIANIGYPVRGKFICFKVGHKINGEFVKLFTLFNIPC